MSALPSIDVVIVNYRTGGLVVDCLDSLEIERSNLLGLRAIVVDNCSPDGSADLIEQAIGRRGWGEWVSLIRSLDNRGFGAGNNIGIDAALSRPEPPDIVWLLNPDTRVMPGASAELARFMADHPRAGITGTALLEGDGRPWPYAFRFPTISSEFERGARWGVVSRMLKDRAVPRRMGPVAEQVDWVSGASMTLRRTLLDTGLRFDETFFLYYEETDLCLQARQLGWECWYTPDSLVLHIAGQSTGVTVRGAAPRRLPGYWFKSRQYFFRKNHGRLYALLADLGWLSGHAIARCKRALGSAAAGDPPRLMSDFVRHALMRGQSIRSAPDANAG